MVMRHRIRAVQRIAVTITLVVTFAACSGDDDSGGASTPPLPTPPATSTPSSNDAATTSTASTVADSSTTSLNPVPSITDPTTTTTAPIELPPVTTLVPEVSPELLTPEQLDPANPNNNRPIQPEHLPVLEAYLSSIQATTQGVVDVADRPECAGASRCCTHARVHPRDSGGESRPTRAWRGARTCHRASRSGPMSSDR